MTKFTELKIGDRVINPEKRTEANFLDDIFPDTAPEITTVRAIIEKDPTTEEQGYTKRVSRSSAPDAFVYLDGIDITKYRLKDLQKTNNKGDKK